jgi:hypothetical protein
MSSTPGRGWPPGISRMDGIVGENDDDKSAR